ncbi:hypothetical protein [Desulfoplanes formicivorans]|nr:hypothetical protein [Desulfoplanes formicivorans]
MWERSKCHVPVSIIEHQAHFAFQGMIYNVCDAGLYVEAGYRIQPSRNLILRLSDETMVGLRTLETNVFYLGEVVWTRNLVHSLTADYGLGIRLLVCERKDTACASSF